MADWIFNTDGSWRIPLAGAPTEETKRAYWEVAVPAIAATELGPAPTPCVVVARVQAPPPPGRSAAAGPRARAKALLDALHDNRRSGPMYAELGLRAPLEDDSPAHVAGLAVEVRPGPEPRVEYRLGRELEVKAELTRAIEVPAAAPNDIVGTPEEKDAITTARVAFAEATRSAWLGSGEAIDAGQLTGLVIRHHRNRDEDNTWATWVAALCGTTRTNEESPWRGAPLPGWTPTAIASVADPTLPVPTRFELYAG